MLIVHIAITSANYNNSEESNTNNTNNVSSQPGIPSLRKKRKTNDLLRGESLKEFLSEYSQAELGLKNDGKYSPWGKYNTMLKHALHTEKRFSFVRKKIQSWSFDPLKYGKDELRPYAKAMYDNIDAASDEFTVNMEKCTNFIQVVLNGYRDVAYHNAYHALSVAHNCHMYVTDTIAKEYLVPIERVALLTAGFGHDIDHPGTNNGFQISSSTPLAMLYNDVSVLENHHAATTCKIFSKLDCQFIETENKSILKYFRSTIIKSILATDMIHHADKVKKVRDIARRVTKARENHKDVDPFDVSNENSRMFLCAIIIHSADLSNPVIYDFEVVYKWASMVCEEFEAQTTMEKEAGLPVTAYLVGVTDNIKKAKLQISFYDYIITPWYEAVAGCLPKARLIYANVEVNRRHWVDIARGQDPQEKLQQIKNAKASSHLKRRGRVRTQSLLGGNF